MSTRRRHRNDNRPGVIYLLHFSRPLGDPSRPRMSARHYLGWSTDDAVVRRIREHREGRGAAITRAAVAAGIELSVVAVIHGTRNDERRLKIRGHHDRRCVLCQKVAA